jgi:hypothetical protein
MGKPFMIQIHDEKRIIALKDKLHARTKIDVVRAGLDLLEKETERLDRIERWKKAVALVSEVSREVNQEFQKLSRLKNF